jgi:hypothetical protein
MKATAAAVLVLILAQALAPAVAGEWTVSGSAGIEARDFENDPAFAEQGSGAQGSVLFEPEFRFRSEDGRHRFSFIPFGRIDGQDSERTHFDLREAYWRFVADDWELLAGIDKVFWGVTESRHLVDVINQTDLVEDIDEEDKLGQPMINVAFQRDWGRIDAFLLAGFRDRTFPGEDGRLRTPVPVDTDSARYESGAGNDRIDAALRYSHYFGDFDLGLSWFHGTGREPRLLPDLRGTALVPHYDVINQGGVDLQFTREAWLWKLEGMVREGQGETFAASVAGFEYTFYQIAGGAADLGLLAEYLYDGRDETAPATIYQDDVFLGIRLAFNDVQDTQALVGAIVDRDNGSVAVNLEAERRLGDRLKLELETRLFRDVHPEDTLAPVQDDGLATLRLSVYF